MTARLAVVGCGTAARTIHLPSLRAGGDGDVVAFASRSSVSAERARDEWGSGDAVDDWRVAVTRPDVDGVLVCVPNARHHEVAATALRAGKHVLVEKPIATALPDADELVALARDGERLLGVSFEGRTSPGLQELQRRLPTIGDVTDVDVTLGHAGPEAWSPDSTWFRDQDVSGGGVLMDLGVHVFDAMRWLLGDVDRVVSADLSVPSGSTDGVEDLAVLQLDVAGSRAAVRLSWRAAQPELRFRFVGDKGELELDGATLRHDGDEVSVGASGLPGTAACFALSISTGVPLAADGADGRAALAVALAGYDAARTCAGVDVT